MFKATCGALWLVGLLSVGCIGESEGETGTGSKVKDATQDPSLMTPPGTNDAGRTPIDANTRYVPEQDATKAQAIATRMWGILTGAQCWHRQNSNDNYSFSGVNDYRYAGYETTAGQIGVNSIGTFGGYDMADIQISHTQYWIGIYDERTFAMSFIHDNGKLVVNWYIASTPGQVCL
jgi:hypothetical protein